MAGKYLIFKAARIYFRVSQNDSEFNKKKFTFLEGLSRRKAQQGLGALVEGAHLICGPDGGDRVPEGEWKSRG